MPNIYVTAVPDFVRREPDLVGSTVRAGSVVMRVTDTIRRCVTTTYDVATGVALPAVLGEVARRRDNVVGVYCDVLVPGEIVVGAPLVMDDRRPHNVRRPWIARASVFSSA